MSEQKTYIESETNDLQYDINAHYEQAENAKTALPVTKEQILSAIETIVNYNGLFEPLDYVKTMLETKRDYYTRPNQFSGGDWEQFEIIWMLLVLLYGNYGTSPRYGWIEKPVEASEFINAITIDVLDNPDNPVRQALGLNDDNEEAKDD